MELRAGTRVILSFQADKRRLVCTIRMNSLFGSDIANHLASFAGGLDLDEHDSLQFQFQACSG